MTTLSLICFADLRLPYFWSVLTQMRALLTLDKYRQSRLLAASRHLLEFLFTAGWKKNGSSRISGKNQKIAILVGYKDPCSAELCKEHRQQTTGSLPGATTPHLTYAASLREQANTVELLQAFIMQQRRLLDHQRMLIFE